VELSLLEYAETPGGLGKPEKNMMAAQSALPARKLSAFRLVILHSEKRDCLSIIISTSSFFMVDPHIMLVDYQYRDNSCYYECSINSSIHPDAWGIAPIGK